MSPFVRAVIAIALLTPAVSGAAVTLNNRMSLGMRCESASHAAALAGDDIERFSASEQGFGMAADIAVTVTPDPSSLGSSLHAEQLQLGLATSPVRGIGAGLTSGRADGNLNADVLGHGFRTR